MTLNDELKDLAGEIDPAQKRPRFRMSTDAWPEEHKGGASYIDSEGVLHFTITFDRRGDDEPAG